jgi:hypothetical protein
MLDQSITLESLFETATGKSVTIRSERPVATRSFASSLHQSFCPLCKAGQHAHADFYGRPEYHCPSSRPWVGWQRVYFDSSALPHCSCEHGQLMDARGLPARCTGHALYVIWAIGEGDLPAPDELGAQYPMVISVTPYELFEQAA